MLITYIVFHKEGPRLFKEPKFVNLLEITTIPSTSPASESIIANIFGLFIKYAQTFNQNIQKSCIIYLINETEWCCLLRN